jgi:1,4-dihydroxy-2-naphthoate octaprenyltransferase
MAKTKNKPVSERSKRKPTLRDWISAARIRTLTLAVAPVAFGTGVASINQGIVWTYAGLALAVAVFLQIGVNYANDYSDGVRGTDDDRVGPFRLTASRKVNPKSVRAVAFVFLALGAAAGVALSVLSNQLWMLAVGAVALLAAWGYTGGKKPYGYAGFGEVVAFLFFGPVAVFGTTYVQIAAVFDDALTILVTGGGALALGFLAAAVLLVNNLRDVATDAPAGKKTLSVRFGVLFSKILFTVFIVSTLAIWAAYPFLYPLTIFAFVAFLLLLPALLIVWTYREPRELILALKLTSFGALAWGALVGWGFSRFLLFV